MVCDSDITSSSAYDLEEAWNKKKKLGLHPLSFTSSQFHFKGLKHEIIQYAWEGVKQKQNV